MKTTNRNLAGTCKEDDEDDTDEEDVYVYTYIYIYMYMYISGWLELKSSSNQGG